MQTCNRYNDYFNCAEHCAGYHPNASAGDDLPAYMYAEDSSSSELVNPWDAPAEAPLRFVPSGVAAWQPVAVTAYSERLEELQNHNHAALEMEYPAMMGNDFDLEFPAMPMAAQDVDYEYTHPATHEHEQPNALAPLLPPGLGLEAQYAQPLHGLAASAWTPTPAEPCTVDARLVARGTPPRLTVPLVSERVAGLGFALSDLLELRLCETALKEYRAALELEHDLEGESDESSSSSGFEPEELDELMRMEIEMEMEREMEMEMGMGMELDDEYVYYTIKDGVQEDA